MNEMIAKLEGLLQRCRDGRVKSVTFVEEVPGRVEVHTSIDASDPKYSLGKMCLNALNEIKGCAK